MLVYPFADHGNFTQFHNALIDSMMPKLSPNAWKILSLVVRQTIGWQRKEWGLSYGAIKRGAGIKSDTTVCKCLKELTGEYELLTVMRSDDLWTENRYALNRKARLDWQPRSLDDPSTPENGAGLPTPKNEGTPKNGVEMSTPKIPVEGKISTSKYEELIEKEENSFKNKKNKSSRAGAVGRPWTDPFCKIFQEAFYQRWQMPYRFSKHDKEHPAGRDFAAFKDARETYGDLFTLEAWSKAVDNYFASPPKPKHVIYHLIEHFPYYLRSARDQYNNLIEDKGSDKKQPSVGTTGGSAGDSGFKPQWRNNRVILGG